jgi:KDO2-lipid IV(A) lauroyltransferase
MVGQPLTLSLLGLAARALPPSADAAIATLAGACTRALAPQRFAAAQENAAALFPAVSARRHARLGERACAGYAQFLIEYLRAQASPSSLVARTDFAPSEPLVRALARGRGAVMCGAHIGNWEAGALALLRLGRPLHVVARPQFATAWRSTARAAKENEGITVSTPDDSPRTLLRHLRAGGIVAVLVDGDGFARGAAARIAGRTVRLPAGPATLAARTGAVLAVGFGERIAPFRFRVALQALAGTAEAPCSDVPRLHAALAAWLERVLLDHPGDWCIFRPYFGASLEPPSAVAALSSGAVGVRP